MADVKVGMSPFEGARKREHQEDDKGFHRFERSYGKFSCHPSSRGR